MAHTQCRVWCSHSGPCLMLACACVLCLVHADKPLTSPLDLWRGGGRTGDGSWCRCPATRSVWVHTCSVCLVLTTRHGRCLSAPIHVHVSPLFMKFLQQAFRSGRRRYGADVHMFMLFELCWVTYALCVHELYILCTVRHMFSHTLS